MITPFAPLEPKTAVAEASFRTEMLWTSHHGTRHFPGARSTGGIRHQKAGDLTGESGFQVLGTRVGELFGRNRGDRTDDTLLFLGTVAHDDRILQEVLIDFQLDEPVEDVPVDRPGLLCIANIGDGQNASGRDRDGEGTLFVSDGSHSGTTNDQNGRANGRHPSLIDDSSAD